MPKMSPLSRSNNRCNCSCWNLLSANKSVNATTSFLKPPLQRTLLRQRLQLPKVLLFIRKQQLFVFLFSLLFFFLFHNALRHYCDYIQIALAPTPRSLLPLTRGGCPPNRLLRCTFRWLFFHLHCRGLLLELFHRFCFFFYFFFDRSHFDFLGVLLSLLKVQFLFPCHFNRHFLGEIPKFDLTCNN